MPHAEHKYRHKISIRINDSHSHHDISPYLSFCTGKNDNTLDNWDSFYVSFLIVSYTFLYISKWALDMKCAIEVLKDYHYVIELANIHVKKQWAHLKLVAFSEIWIS